MRQMRQGLGTPVLGALLLFHGPKHGLCTRENGLIALTYAMLAADALGLGACVNAPVVQVNDDYVEDLDVPTFEALMESMRKGQAPKVGSVIGRQGSAPKGGPKVLIDPKLYDGSRAAPTKIANAPKPAAE